MVFGSESACILKDHSAFLQDYGEGSLKVGITVWEEVQEATYAITLTRYVRTITSSHSRLTPSSLMSSSAAAAFSEIDEEIQPTSPFTSRVTPAQLALSTPLTHCAEISDVRPKPILGWA